MYIYKRDWATVVWCWTCGLPRCGLNRDMFCVYVDGIDVDGIGPPWCDLCHVGHQAVVLYRDWATEM